MKQAGTLDSAYLESQNIRAGAYDANLLLNRDVILNLSLPFFFLQPSCLLVNPRCSTLTFTEVIQKTTSHRNVDMSEQNHFAV